MTEEFPRPAERLTVPAEESALPVTKENTDTAAFEPLVVQSPGLELFYTVEQAAQFRVLRSEEGNEASRHKVTLSGHEEDLLWGIIEKPTANREQKLQRQSVMDRLLQCDDLEALSQHRLDGYQLLKDFTFLIHPVGNEEERVEKALQDAKVRHLMLDSEATKSDEETKEPQMSKREATNRTGLEFLFPEGQDFESVKRVMQWLETQTGGLDIEAWCEKLAEAGYETWERHEVWNKFNLWQDLNALSDKRKACIDLADKLTQSPEPNLVKIGRMFKIEAEALPDFSAEAVFNAWRGEGDLTLKSLKKEAEKIVEHLKKIGALIGMAQHIKQNNFGRADFDDHRPESFSQAWHLKYKVFGHKRHNETKDWQQVPNDAPEYSPVTVFNGSNMSGKSFSMEMIMYLNLCAQAFGYVPAERGNFHNYDAYLFLDRSNTDSDNNLSAFGKEVTNLNEVTAVIDTTSNPCVFADETYSTTSPEDGNYLGQGTLAYLLEQGVRTFWANHNETLNQAVEPWADTRLYHFETGIGEDGDITFLHRMLPGLEDSHSIEVAKRLGLPAELITNAQKFLEGDIVPVKNIEPVTNLVVEYSAEERERLKQESRPIMIFGVGNEALVHPGRDPNDFSPHTAEYNPYLFKPHIAWRYGSPPPYSNDYYYLEEPLPDPAPGVMQAFTNDRQIEKLAWAHIPSKVLEHGESESSQELLERRRLFEALADLKLDFSDINYGILCHIWTQYYDLQTQRGGLIGGPVPGLGLDNFFTQLLQKLPACVQNEHDENRAINPLSTYNLRLLETIGEVFGITEALAPLKEKLQTFLDLSALKSERNPHPYSFEGPGKAWKQAQAEKIKAAEKVAKTKYGKKFHTKESFKALVAEISQVIPEHDLSHIEHAQLKAKLEPLLAEYRVMEQSFRERNHLHDAEIHIGRALELLFGDDAMPHDGVLEALRATDSVHLHQWANYLEPLFEHAFGQRLTGKNLFNQLAALPDDEARAQYIKTLNPYYYIKIFNSLLTRLETLKDIADGFKAQGFCPVEFGDENRLEITQGWNLMFEVDQHSDIGYETPVQRALRGKKLQIRNHSTYDPQKRVNLITGSNMSGKTFLLKSHLAATTVGLSTGMGPADSMVMPHFDGTVYVDRVHKKEKGLSAFGQDCVTWKALLERVDSGENLFVAVDEAFSTVSPRFQAALTYAATKYLAERGCTLALSSHNHQFIEAFMTTNPDVAQAWHLETNVKDDGSVEFTHRKKAGHAPSLGVAVAKHLGLKPEIVEHAQRLQAQA